MTAYSSIRRIDCDLGIENSEWQSFNSPTQFLAQSWHYSYPEKYVHSQNKMEETLNQTETTKERQFSWC